MIGKRAFVVIAALSITAGLASLPAGATPPTSNSVTTAATGVARLGVQIPLAQDSGHGSYVRLHWAPAAGARSYVWRSYSSVLTTRWQDATLRRWTTPAPVSAVHACTPAERAGLDTVGDETTLTRTGGATSFTFPQLSGRIPAGDLCGFAFQAPHTTDTPRVAFQVLPAGTAPTADTRLAWTPCPVSAFVSARGSGEGWQSPVTYNTLPAQVQQFNGYIVAQKGNAVAAGHLPGQRKLTENASMLAGLGDRGARTFLMATQPGITNYGSTAKGALNRWAVRPVAVPYQAEPAGPVVDPGGAAIDIVGNMVNKWFTYKPSLDDGVAKTRQIVADWNAQCSSQLTLFGYSQGAQVMGNVANNFMTWGFAQPRPSLAKNIEQVFLFSDPEADPGKMPDNAAQPMTANPENCHNQHGISTAKGLWGRTCGDGYNPYLPQGKTQGPGVWRYLGKDTASRTNLSAGAKYKPPLFHWCWTKDLICSLNVDRGADQHVHGDIYDHYEPAAAAQFLFSFTGDMTYPIWCTGGPKSLAATYTNRQYAHQWSGQYGWYGKTPDFPTFAKANAYSVPPNA